MYRSWMLNEITYKIIFLKDCTFRTWNGISLCLTGKAQAKTIKHDTQLVMEQNTKQVSP